MTKTRLEAFSDAVIAIIITIMVLELKVPHGGRFEDLTPLIPVILSYILSFIYLGIYWNNHHHLFHASTKVNGAILWANSHLLFWLSLVPFATSWMGENHFQEGPMVLYGLILLFSGLSYTILQYTIIRAEGEKSFLKMAVGTDLKGKSSVFLYLLGIALAFVNPWASGAVYVFVALMWLIPDPRIEKKLNH